MATKFKIILLLLCGAIPLLQGQSERDKKIRNFLQELHNGALLVRLDSKSRTLQKLEEQGRDKRKARLSQKQHRKNKEILLSFEETFTFAPVYFFYAKNSEAIRQHKFEGVIFDSQRQKVSASEFPETFYTAEFSKTPNLKITGLIVMDDKLIPLEPPLPFYERKFRLLGIIALSKARMIEKYNEKLQNLYQKYFPEE